MWVYEQRAGGTLQRGLIGALALSPPEDGVVLPHEDVIPEVVEDRAALMRATAANLEPLLLAWHGTGSTADAVERTAARRPSVETTTADGTRHRLWPVREPAELAALTGGLRGGRALIADGHHRWATYLRLCAEHAGRPPWDRGLVLLVDTARYPLRVQPVHRVLPTLPPAAALARLNGAFRTRHLGSRAAEALDVLGATPGTAFLLAGDGHIHLLDRPDPALLERTVRHDRPPAWRRLDATVLQAALLGDLWRADVEPGTVRHLHDADTAVAQAERAGGSAVLMRAVAEPTVRELAEAGVTMPHKSTSFGPKPATGLLLRALDIADEN